MPAIVDQIRAWATQLDYWEQMALGIVATGRDLTEADYQTLLDHFMRDAGLIQMPKSPKAEVSSVYTAATRTSYRLERLF